MTWSLGFVGPAPDIDLRIDFEESEPEQPLRGSDAPAMHIRWPVCVTPCLDIPGVSLPAVIICIVAAPAGPERDPAVLSDRLFFYAGSRDAVPAGHRARDLGIGVVVQDQATLRRLRAVGVDDLMLDPALYRRAFQAELPGGQLEREWVKIQSEHQVTAYLSPTGHVPDGNVVHIRDALARGSTFVDLAGSSPHPAPAFAVLPVRYTWLTRHLASLLDLVSEARVPIALVLSAPTNPLESRLAVAGLVALLRAHPTVALLRSDFSVIAGLAHGAGWGAIGTATSTRHYIAPGDRGGFSDDPSPSLLVRDLMRYMKGGLVGRIVDAGCDIDCRCSTCEGRSLGRFYYSDPDLRVEGLLHSMTEVAAAAGNVTRHPLPERPAIWASLCRRAIEFHDEIRVSTRLLLPEPDYLVGWVEAGAAVASHRS